MAWCAAVSMLSIPITATVIDRVMAVVSGRVITLTDVRAAIELGLIDTAGAVDPVGAALRKLIARQLMLDEVKRYVATEPADALVEGRLQAIRKRGPNRDALILALDGFGMSEGHLRDMVRDDLRIESDLAQRFDAAARPTDQEVEEYAREHERELTRDSRPLPQPQALELARSRLQDERRRVMIDEWVARLRRRAEVSELYLGPAS